MVARSGGNHDHRRAMVSSSHALIGTRPNRLRLTTAALPAAVADSSDLEARGRMLIGAHLAGRALALSGLGLVQGIGHALTASVPTRCRLRRHCRPGPALRPRRRVGTVLRTRTGTEPCRPG
ncbi:iron-containing alcohol dehydrogenase [Nocardia terpenica]